MIEEMNLEIQEEEQEQKKKSIIPKIGLALLGLIMITYAYMHFLEPKLLKIKEYAIINDKIPSNFDGFKITQFGDIHFGNTTTEKEIEKLVEKINETKPDILVFTGDLFDDGITLSENTKNFLKETLKKTNATLGKYAIKGDHDYKDMKEFESIMTEANFHILENKNIPIYYKGVTPIYLSGIPSLIKKEHNILQALEKEEQNVYQILLTHEPIIFDEIKQETNLVLAGHNLGGTIRLPFIGGLVNQENIGEYKEEKYQKGKSTMYITNGIGTSKINLRFNNTPSISLYRLYHQ